MLNICSKADCCPLEQVRGELGAGDYHDVIVNNARGSSGSVPEPEKYGIPVWVDKGETTEGKVQEHCVEMNDAMKDDFRICCKTCGRATRWGTKDIPGMPGAGADWMRKHWNEHITAC